MKVCFIGHRQVEVTEELRSELCALLLDLIREGATEFLFGDHSQFNDLCYDASRLPPRGVLFLHSF